MGLVAIFFLDVGGDLQGLIVRHHNTLSRSTLLLQEMAELGRVVDGDLRQRERRNGLLTQLHGIAEVIQGQRMDRHTGILHFVLMLGGRRGR